MPKKDTEGGRHEETPVLAQDAEGEADRTVCGGRSADEACSTKLSTSKEGKHGRSPMPESPSEDQRHGNVESAGRKVATSPKGVGQGRVRRAPENTAESIPIPRTLSAFSPADKTMWEMRKAGKGWEEIRMEWERITGQRVAGTTLPNRYVRIKENIGDFTDDDDELLLRCKQGLEITFSDEIWSMIAESMTAKGGNKFSAAAIQKRFKQLRGDEFTGES